MNKISRRRFVRKTLTVFAGLSCFSYGLAEALAQAKRAGKPLLTAENLNVLFRNKAENKMLAAEAARDVRGFLRKRFFLTEIQNAHLEKWSERKLRELTKLLRSVAKDGGEIRVADNPIPTRGGAALEAGKTIKGHAFGTPSPTPQNRKIDVDVKVGTAEAHYHDEW
jgi:hypothetical protein